MSVDFYIAVLYFSRGFFVLLGVIKSTALFVVGVAPPYWFALQLRKRKLDHCLGCYSVFKGLDFSCRCQSGKTGCAAK